VFFAPDLRLTRHLLGTPPVAVITVEARRRRALALLDASDPHMPRSLRQEALGEVPEEVCARDDTHDPALAQHGDDEHAVVEEGLGDLDVGRVGDESRESKQRG
jgi:hypothetical protein